MSLKIADSFAKWISTNSNSKDRTYANKKKTQTSKFKKKQNTRNNFSSRELRIQV